MSKLRKCIILGIPTDNRKYGQYISHKAIKEAKRCIANSDEKVPLKTALECMYEAKMRLKEKKDA